MPELSNRDEYERRLLRELSRASAEVVLIVRDALGYPPDATRITPELMAAVNAVYGPVLTEQLERVFIDSARGMAIVNVPFDMDAIEAAAGTWSAEYVPARLRQMEETTRNRLLKVVAAAAAANWARELLDARIGRVFGRSRMENIAITETTFVQVAGEQEVARQIRERTGTLLFPMHQTANDDRVCLICGPRNQQQIFDGRFPPLHGGCRCWVSWSHEAVE